MTTFIYLSQMSQTIKIICLHFLSDCTHTRNSETISGEGMKANVLTILKLSLNSPKSTSCIWTIQTNSTSLFTADVSKHWLIMWGKPEYSGLALNVYVYLKMGFVITLPIRRHVFCVHTRAPLGYHIHLCSKTPFVFGDEETIMPHLTKVNVSCGY